MPAGRATTTSMSSAAPTDLAQSFALQLRFLVDVAGGQRRVFVRGRTLDVPVDAHRAAVDEPGDAGCPGGVEECTGAAYVYRVVGRVGLTRNPVGGGDVIDDVDSVAGAGQRRVVGQIPENDLDAGLPAAPWPANDCGGGRVRERIRPSSPGSGRGVRR